MGFTIVVPTLNILDETGRIDMQATRRYAELARDTWVDRFLLNGSTTRGDLLSPASRAEIVDLWAEVVGPDRLLACAWAPADFEAAAQRHVTPMGVMHGIRTGAEALVFLRGLPHGATIYSHPMFGLPLTPELVSRATDVGCLPAGGKLAKVKVGEISEIHQLAPDFALWDGSVRHLRESLQAGAAGVVATPLAPLLVNGLPPKDVDKVQAAVSAVQSALDVLPDRPSRSAYLLGRTSQALAGVE